MAPRFVPHLVADTLTYVRQHLTERLTTAALAQRWHLPPALFARRFKSLTGQSPQAALLQLRLTRALHLLDTSSEPLAIVAKQAGFCDQSHFTLMFRQTYGVTPGEYRASHVSRTTPWLRVCALWPGVSADVQAEVLRLLEGAAQGE